MYTTQRPSKYRTREASTMESKSCDTSLSRSDLNSAFCDTSQNSLSSVDTLSFGEGSSRQDCAFEQSAHKDVQTICSNESSKAGASDSGTELTARMEQSLSNSIYLDNGTDPRGKLVTPKPKTRLTMVCVLHIKYMLIHSTYM